jgi:DNA-binding GntR family transcriptional regulator
MIIEGELGVEERLNEINLAETLNVSRTPVREALKLLAEEGLLELLPGRGAQVKPLSPDEFGKIFEVVAGLERLAVELAVERMSADELLRLRQLHDAMSAHYAAGRRHEYFALNVEIHAAIVEGAKNEMLSSTHAALMVKARRGRYTALATADRWRKAMEEHEAVIEAMEHRDSAAAGRAPFLHDLHIGEAGKLALATASCVKAD